MQRHVIAALATAALWMGANACSSAASVPEAAIGTDVRIRSLTDEADRHRQAANLRAWAETLARRAEILQGLGHRQRALADLREAAGALAGDGATALHAAVLGALGQATFLAGRPDEALPLLTRARALAQEARAGRVTGAVLNDLGILLAATGRNDEARATFAAAASSATDADDRMLVGKVRLNSARLDLRAGNRSAAATLAREAAGLFGTQPRSAERALRLAEAGALLRELAAAGSSAETTAAAHATLVAATQAAQEVADPRALAVSSRHHAELYLDQGRLREALALNERALFHAQASASPDLVFFAQWQAARILGRQGSVDAALDAYRRSLAGLAEIKADLAADLWAGMESFTERIGPAYLGYADLLLRRAAATADVAAKRAALRQTQTALEGLRQIELEDYFRDDCVARTVARTRGIEQVAPRTAVLYPVPLGDRLELVVSVGEELHQLSVPVADGAIDREARALRGLLEKRTTFQYLPHAQRLYDWLVRPVEALLARFDVDTIVLVPDRHFRGIPLAALHDGKDFLIARYAVAIAPSLTLVEPRPLKPAAVSVLASGLTESVQGFSALPYVDAELEQLGAMRAGAVLRDQSFTTANLERELTQRSYSIVHVASHAQFEADSRRSFVLTYDGRMSIDQLEHHMKLGRFRDEPVELLFLSACQTAAGDERAALGLAGVAVKAGARSALATLWHINDHASSLLVSEFYRNYARGDVSKAQALRRAQVALLGDLRYRHPGYWSPFLMIGNWL